MILSAMVGGLLFGFEDSTLPMFAFQLFVALCFCIPLWSYGKRLNSEKKEYIDKETGKEVTIRSEHSFFEVRLEYWAIIIPLIIVGVATYSLLGF